MGPLLYRWRASEWKGLENGKKKSSVVKCIINKSIDVLRLISERALFPKVWLRRKICIFIKQGLQNYIPTCPIMIELYLNCARKTSTTLVAGPLMVVLLGVLPWRTQRTSASSSWAWNLLLMVMFVVRRGPASFASTWLQKTVLPFAGKKSTKRFLRRPQIGLHCKNLK